MSSPNPLDDFLKYAETRKRVRTHTRIQGGKLVLVGSHDRQVRGKQKSEQRTVPPQVDESQARKQRELALWGAWVQGGKRKEDLEPLLKSFEPLIHHMAGPYLKKLYLVPDASILAEFKLQLVEGLHTYDPSKGASLGTHLQYAMRKAKRFIAEHQNMGRIPENRIYKIKKFEETRDALAEKLERDATDEELAKSLGWSTKEVRRMSEELRGDYTAQGFEDDPTSLIPSREAEVLKLFKYELEGDELAVYEHLTGYGREQITSTSELGKRLGLKDYQVSRIKDKIRSRISQYL